MKEIIAITDVVAALNDIIRACSLNQNKAGYFAALYKRMTVAVADGIRDGYFEDGKRMEALDVVFAQRYLSAFKAFQETNIVSASWRCAFTGCGNRSLIVLQHLLLGINSHINLDLAIAAATVAPGEKIAALQTDFNRINNLIALLVDDVQHSLEQVWFPMRLLKNIVNKQGMAVMNFSIEAARETAWANAVALAKMEASAQANHIRQMDAIVQQIGERIIHPGAWPALIIKLIRFSGYENPARTIHLIDSTVV